ncbi:uncharacterized protein LOC126906288 [Daktulosphaira vitifoliae]|uniref:uncharacterized protein LOC126906288 n=1 Tax=Daktulosphaira vitifoliae TaxID=58002 RepID=UPI0021A97E92|nr:uncharacterized protein LOC126906288 [Daktulosphaira vitifoliae]
MESTITLWVIVTFVLYITSVNGQINRYINPLWLELDANSEYYPGGEVVAQLLRSYGFGDDYRNSGYRSQNYRRDDGYRSLNFRDKLLINNYNNLNNVYDFDQLTPQEYLSRNYDYIDSTIRRPIQYQNNFLNQVPRRTKIDVIPVSRNSYLPSEYINRRVIPKYSNLATPVLNDLNSNYDTEVMYRNHDYSNRILNPRSTTTPITNEDNNRQQQKSQ